MKPEDIRIAREKAGLSQAELADKLGVSRATVSKYESGRLIPTVVQANKIAAALNTTVQEAEETTIEPRHNNVCIITRDLPEPPGTSRHVGISSDLYLELLNLSKDTGRSIRYLANQMLKFALSRLEVQDE